MKSYTYAVCPHCEHPNIHVEEERLAEHYAAMGASERCLGSRIVALAPRSFCLTRHEPKFHEEIAKAKSALVDPAPLMLCAFQVWKFSGIEYLAVPVDAGNVHIMDALGGNYGSWMSVTEFRKRQHAGDLADWSQLGSAVARIVPIR